MKWFKRIFILLLVLFIGGFLHYFLPSRDIVQIVGTDVKRMDIGDKPWFWDKADAGTDTHTTRDVRFINANWPNGKARVYRNEDTDWSFPPYFKFDSGNLSAEAQGLAKNNEEVWVAVGHYGWRIELFSMYPNAYKVKRVSGPDVFLIPWFNIVFLGMLVFLCLWVFQTLRGLKHRHVDPVADKIGDKIDNVQEAASKRGNTISRFFRRWFGSSK